MRRFLRNNGLSLVLALLFLGTVIGQFFTGHREHNQSRQDHGQPPLTVGQYLHEGHLLEALAENWESEFLQMALFVLLTAWLYQKGSPESKDPDAPEEDELAGSDKPDAPWPVKRGGWVLWLYSHSLSLTFISLFLASMWLHALGGMWEYNQDQAEHGQPAVSLIGYVATSRFWFESLQNWQSEFLSLLAMVGLSVFLREKGSQESKALAMPHHVNEE